MEKVRVFPLGISFRRLDECHIGELPCFELESGRLLEVKGHRTFRNFLAMQQLGRLTCHLTCHHGRFGSYGYLLNRVNKSCAVTATIAHSCSRALVQRFLTNV